MLKGLLYYLLAALAYVFSVIPLRIHYIFVDMLSWMAWKMKLYRYKVILRNLRSSFPDKTDREISHIAREYYRHLLDCMVESLKLLTMNNRQLDRRVKVYGVETMTPAVEAGKQIVLFLGHYGNWEWVPAITRHFSRPEVMAQIYRPLRDPVSARLTFKIRHRFGALNIPQKQAFRTLLTLKNQGKQTITGFIADQRPNSANLNHWTTFLGQDTAYAPGGEEIGRRIDAAYFYLDVEKTSRGHYSLTFIPIEPVEGEEYPYTIGYLRMLESTIRRAPAYWLWSHNRWKFKRTRHQ
ncbi:MAG: lysophospholipid acyltransferase family protein [Muribaculaceae bacterium]|nr:lysophospholipid acyltransferase family protein [Muribaculaceae bacterium]